MPEPPSPESDRERLAVFAAEVSAEAPDRPPPPPTDWARMPLAWAPDVLMVPLLTTVTMPPVAPLPPLPPSPAVMP